MLNRTHRSGRFVLVAVVVAALATAHVRLVTSSGTPLYWGNESNVSIVINSDGSDDITDGSHETALRNAIAEWNDVTGTTAQLVEDQSPSQQARRDYESGGIHLVLFDENDDSGYFPGFTGIVAVTPVFFFSNGRIDDADVIYNGKEFQFTTSGEPGRFDVQDVGTHELGHLLGLDHSGWAGASMFPYVDPTMILHRSVSIDDVRGLRDAYSGPGYATISGRILRADLSPVSGAHVVARTSGGRTAGATLTRSNGQFTLEALAAGTYTVYATPLEGAVSAGNFNWTAAYSIQTDFESTVFTPDVVLGAGESHAMGDQQVGANVTIRLGKAFGDVYPLRVVEGEVTALTVRGTGLSGATLTCSDPSILITQGASSSSSIAFTAGVLGGATPGHADLVVTSGGEASILPAALEITHPDPTVLTVTPGSADAAGGSAVTITGDDFNAGARVVIGDRIYRDGEPGGCTVVPPDTIILTMQQTVPGTHDVVVIDSTGVEGRLPGALQATPSPAVATVFPDAGDSAGGTQVVLTGTNFVAGATVSIGGSVQTNVTVDSPTRMTIDTDPGTPGLKTVIVTNPGGASSMTAYSYVLQADPTVTAVSPASSSTSGGKTVRVTGSNFTPGSEVVFGASAATGEGGVPAEATIFVDANTLDVVVPAHGAGDVNLLVSDASGQAAVMVSAFSYMGSSGGGGGGGCSGSIAPGPPTWRQVLSSCAWMLVAGYVLWRHSRRAVALAPARHRA